jgi:hypothetical protein
MVTFAHIYIYGSIYVHVTTVSGSFPLFFLFYFIHLLMVVSKGFKILPSSTESTTTILTWLTFFFYPLSRVNEFPLDLLFIILLVCVSGVYSMCAKKHVAFGFPNLTNLT